MTLVGVRLFWTPFLMLCGSYLVEDDGPRKADAVVVLGGDQYGARVVKGAQLAAAGYAPVVLVSGPKRLVGYDSSDEVQYAEQQGYPASLFREVHLPGQDAGSTRSEARFLGSYLAAQGMKSILLVTSNYHTKRAAKLWRLQNPTLGVTVVAAPDPFFAPDRWWKTRTGQKTFVYEWMKTISVMLGV
jgi:uncharacterized SAM-binding protein YcdF (DUF218 family)